jgi:hypothetical protein
VKPVELLRAALAVALAASSGASRLPARLGTGGWAPHGREPAMCVCVGRSTVEEGVDMRASETVCVFALVAALQKGLT